MREKIKNNVGQYAKQYRVIENKSAESLARSQKVIKRNFNQEVDTIYIPESENSSGFYINFGDEKCKYKKCLMYAIRAGVFHIVENEKWSDTYSKPCKVLREFNLFVRLDEFTANSRVNIIKDFEAYRVDCKIKIQSTGASFLINLLKRALQVEEFIQSLKIWEFDFLFGLTKTKLSARDDVVPVTLNHWFTAHSWLSRDDVGIGRELYKRLSSPKALMNSFRITVTTLLLTIQSAKHTLSRFFNEASMSSNDFPDLGKRKDFESASAHQEHMSESMHSFFVLLKNKLKQTEESSELNLAIELVIYSNVKKSYRKKATDFLIGKKDDLGKRVFFTANKREHPIFYIEFLSKLLTNKLEIVNNTSYPVCKAEQILFAWLMAYQTVQPSDIQKLKKSDFKFLTQRNGIVRYIECDYFKGRAKRYYQVETLSVNEDIGSSVLAYITDVATVPDSVLVPKQPIAFITGKQSTLARIMLSLEISSLNIRLISRLKQENTSPVFYKAFEALIANGIPRHKRLKNFSLKEVETPLRQTFFGMSSIKTSSVYAATELFDPTSLLNFNSHSDQTEQNDYRVERNEEWNNICGRVTRAVMRDLAVNVMRCSQTDRQLFNSEFTKALDFIKIKSDEVLATLKVVTKQVSGRVNELGIVKSADLTSEHLPDCIFIDDSPHTIMKLKHYVSEVESKHKELRRCSPTYFFSTVLPTTEWIETLFYEEMFSITSIKEGSAMYEQYKNILPPHFTHKIN